MSVSTAKTLNSIFSSPAWMLLPVLGLLALIACFFIRGKKKVIPIITCVLSLCLFLLTLGIKGSAGQVICQQVVQDDYTKQWSDLLDECARDQTTYRDRYLNGSGDGQSGGDADPTPTPQASSGEPEMGIEYSYWLRLDQIPGESYEVDIDDISYELVDYDNYISVYITNKGSKDVSIGGEYRLQRLIDGKYTDIEDDMNLKYGDVHVQDMPLIVMYDDLNGVELPLADEDGTFVIGAGQRVLANFLTLRHRIFDSPEYTGDYRLIYGDVVIDFKLFCDVVC